MIGIADIAYYLPPGRVSNLDRKEAFALTDAFITEKLGVTAVARRSDGQETSDLCVEAARALLARGNVRVDEIECVVVVTQNPDGRGLPHASAVVHAKLGLPARCLTFDIGLGCSGYVAALAIVTATMASQGLRKGLLFTADPYSKIVDPDDRNTALLFGDGASATLLDDAPVWQLGRFDFVAETARRAALAVQPDGRLQMNGRAVFDFCATAVPASIRRTAEANGVPLDQVDRFVLHQGSRFIVDTIAARLGAADRTPFDAADYGNTVSSSIPIALARAVAAGDQAVILSGFGVGLNVASTLLRRDRADSHARRRPAAQGGTEQR
jgi:3-oxoacyl-[acyl-carrier-protein] synthase-3